MNPAFRLCAVLFLAFCLRIAAVNFGLPGTFHADEPVVVNHALAYGGGDLNPHFFKIPPLVSYLLFFAYGIMFLVGRVFGQFASVSDFENLFYADPSAFYLSGRILIGVIPGVLCVFALYRFTRKYFSESAALVSALFLAVSFLHVRDSHYIYTDIILNLCMIAAFHVFFRNESTVKNALISGALIGLCAAVKYNGAVLAVIYAFYALIARPKYLVRDLLIAGFSSVFVFICLNPFSVLDSAAFFNELAVQGRSQAGTRWIHHLTYSLPEALGFTMFATALAACASGVFERDARVKTLAVFSFLYYAVLIRAGQSYDRYVLPMLPFLCLLAALFWDRRFRSAGIGQKILRFSFLFLLLSAPLTKSVLWNSLMGRDDVRTQAKSWIEENVPAGSAIAMEWEFYMPRLNFSKEQLAEKKTRVSADPASSAPQMRKLDFLIQRSGEMKGYNLHFLVSDPAQDRFLFASPAAPYNLKDLKAKGIQYVLTADYEGKTVPPEFFAELEAGAEKVKIWSPFLHPEQRYSFDSQPLTGGPFTAQDIVSRERNGYFLTLYRLR